MKLGVFYNGTDSNYTKDFEETAGYPCGEIVSRFGKYACDGEKNSQQFDGKQINGLGGGKEKGKSKRGGSTLGRGMREDVEDIVIFVKEAREKLVEASGDGVNLEVMLMGWSRGAIGCIWAAHELSKEWIEIGKDQKPSIGLDIKMVVFDPVAGAGTNWRASGDDRWWELPDVKWWQLPEHVTEFHGFYARDERTSGFAATMPSMVGNPENRNWHIYEVPGTHSTMVGEIRKQFKSEAAHWVAKLIYCSVVKKVGALMEAWGFPLDSGAYKEWILCLEEKAKKKGEDYSPSLSDWKEFMADSQKESILGKKVGFAGFSRAKGFIDASGSYVGLTDGRGVYLGDNRTDRKWKPDVDLENFLDESNRKAVYDPDWGTKLGKLGGDISVHNYEFFRPGWG